MLLLVLPQDFLAREGQVRRAYPAEVDRWYAFLHGNLEAVDALVGRANELAVRHNLTPPPLRPLVATPLVLKLREEELVAEKEVILIINTSCFRVLPVLFHTALR